MQQQALKNLFQIAGNKINKTSVFQLSQEFYASGLLPKN
jgi:hypothetical protein